MRHRTHSVKVLPEERTPKLMAGAGAATVCVCERELQCQDKLIKLNVCRSCLTPNLGSASGFTPTSTSS